MDFAEEGGDDTNAVNSGVSICQLCMERPAEEVLLYTSKQVQVVAPNLICSTCATMEPEQAAEIAARRARIEDGTEQVRLSLLQPSTKHQLSHTSRTHCRLWQRRK